MIDRSARGEHALLVQPEFHGRDAESDLREFQELAVSANLTVAGVVRAPIRDVNPRYFVGSGKAREIGAAVETHEAELVLVNHALAPVQERNLEKLVAARVHDRNTLILDIFAQRARSHEGKLQVELAQLRHLSTRLVRGWTHLERQKGGIGLRGPGETQLETDRRLLAARVRAISDRLGRVDRQRTQSRRGRHRGDRPVVALIGYTNAGKSTLFNRLTDAGVYEADKLFATLDPSLRQVALPHGRGVILADTVGFIRELPHELVAAFKSTLDETRDADLLLHVVDAADPDREERVSQVREVLADIGAADVPSAMVYNKIDLTSMEPGVCASEDGTLRSARVSALTGEGIEALLGALADHFARHHLHRRLRLPPSAGRLRSQLFALGAVRGERDTAEGGWQLDVQLPRLAAERLKNLGDAEKRVVREQLLG